MARFRAKSSKAEPEQLDDNIEQQPQSARAWQAAIDNATKYFKSYQDVCDKIDKLYGGLDRLANNTRDREFQMFWANMQTLKPAIYSRPPKPVCTPRNNDRRPLYRTASDLVERTMNTSFDQGKIDRAMLHIRDDLAIHGRGVMWLSYEAGGSEREGGKVELDYEAVCYDHLDRKDFLHQPGRYWYEVGWVAKRSWLTKEAAKKRFPKVKPEIIDRLAYAVRTNGQSGNDDQLQKAGIWEIWDKENDQVVWHAEGAEELLEQAKPHLDLEDGFPCPEPAYGTLERRTTIPIPDMLQYRDQLEEINVTTARIGALTESLRVRGFYPAGMADVGSAIEAVMQRQDDRQILVGIPNWAAFGDGVSPKDMIVWVPLDVIANALTGLVQIRKQLIDDVYQITGLSDIMRGDTEASETLGAQQLKSQYGSMRVRDLQAELVRIAGDGAGIAGEIICENFSSKTLLAMSQMELPTDKDQQNQVRPLEQQLAALTKTVEQQKASPQYQQAMATPEGQQQVQQAIDQANQKAQELGQQIAKIKAVPTLEDVVKLLRDENLRPFALDIETDSTIAPDEQAQKAAATEYLTAMGGLLAQALPALQLMPSAAPLVAESIRFAQSQFRVGRSMDQVVDEFVESMKQVAAQPKPPSPEEIKAQQDQAQQAQKAKESDQAHQVEMARQQEMTQRAVIETHGAEADKAERIAKAQSDAVTARERALKVAQEEAVLPVKVANETERERLKTEQERLKVEHAKIQLHTSHAGLAKAKNDNAAANKAALDAGAQPGEPDENGNPQAVDLGQAILAQLAQHGQTQQQLAAYMQAPRSIVRDPRTGQATHVRVEGFGDRPIARDQAGNVVGA